MLLVLYGIAEPEMFFVTSSLSGGLNWMFLPRAVPVNCFPAILFPNFINWIFGLLSAFIVLFLFTAWRINTVRKQERAKADRDKELLIIQTRALNAQMNPHFIFNCLNSIKYLVQSNKNSDAVDYLSLFAKLTRSLMQYSEKLETTLHNELQICQWYLELEKLRFGDKVRVHFKIDEKVNADEITVPLLLIQPFIENAVWHGLVPKQQEDGLLEVNVTESGDNLLCIIEDNGIGRAAAMRRATLSKDYKSKGMEISQQRLNLHNSQQEQKVSIEIQDKFDDSGEPNGTRVLITFLNYLHH